MKQTLAGPAASHLPAGIATGPLLAVSRSLATCLAAPPRALHESPLVATSRRRSDHPNRLARVLSNQLGVPRRHTEALTSRRQMMSRTSQPALFLNGDLKMGASVERLKAIQQGLLVMTVPTVVAISRTCLQAIGSAIAAAICSSPGIMSADAVVLLRQLLPARGAGVPVELLPLLLPPIRLGLADRLAEAALAGEERSSPRAHQLHSQKAGGQRPKVRAKRPSRCCQAIGTARSAVISNSPVMPCAACVIRRSRAPKMAAAGAAARTTMPIRSFELLRLR